jgi:LytS/YehU family sensor histidine kinase
LGQCYNYLSQYYATVGNFERAYHVQAEYFAIHDSLNNSEMAASITELQTKYETEKKEQEIVLLTKDTEIKDLKIKRQNAFTSALIGVVILIIVVGVLWFSRLREKQMREKTELEKTNLETEQKLLRAQINPHFMFNALNSVQSYISGNDNLKAMTYLAKFSQLMRNILENSRKSMITIEEEVNTLTLYMGLEVMRFKDAFEFEVRISDSIIPSRTYIPPMLIQPFVENSIKHGFRHLDIKGKLLIDFFAMNGTLSCKIEDNGIGRLKSMQIIDSKNMNHKSLGMVVIRERLMALAKARKVKAKCEIEDMVIGTRVLLDMPYEVE